MKKLLLFVFLSLITTASFSQTFNKQRLDSLFQVFEKKDKFMGSIAISQNGKLLYANAIGFADLETSKRSDIHTKYRIGSISKIFTASLILKAVEEKKIKLDQTLDTYFPQIENSHKITIENLLNHRSGIHNFTDDPFYLDYNTTFRSQKEMIGIIANGKSDFEPDTSAGYSNSNYVLLSYILEKIYKNDYNLILDDKIIKPLGLKNTYFGGKTNLRTNESYSFRFKDKWTKEAETDMSIPIGAGAIVSNPTDLTIFIDQLFAGKVISEKSLTSMRTMNEKFGLGIFEFMYNDKIGYGHTGGIDGFQSVVNYFPEEELAIAIISNGTMYPIRNILLCAESSCFNDSFELPTFESLEIDPDILNAYVGQYASSQIPLKITISKQEKHLMAQATGQSAFPLDATAANSFKFEPAGIVLEFNVDKKEMTLKQGGGEFLFTKE